MTTKWLPIEIAPKDGTDIIVRCNQGVDIASFECECNDYCGEPCCWSGRIIIDCQPTHWIPIPEFEQEIYECVNFENTDSDNKVVTDNPDLPAEFEKDMIVALNESKNPNLLEKFNKRGKYDKKYNKKILSTILYIVIYFFIVFLLFAFILKISPDTINRIMEFLK